MPGVRVDGVIKRYRTHSALAGASLEAPSGRLTAVLGPSGCGKSTLLRVIAGLEDPDAGEVSVGEEVVTSVARQVSLAPSSRGIGMVFQSYALWPHLTVFENIAFPLRVQRRPEEEVRRRVADVMSLVRLPDLAARHPSQVSGGEQQRVALARSLVYNPRVLLLDEPLANLDARVRDDVRTEIRRLQHKVGVTTLYVTHDQAEALELADRVVLMNAGRVVQQGDPGEVYRRPATRFAAEFLGASNVVEGRAAAGRGTEFAGVVVDAPVAGTPGPDGRVALCLRPEDAELTDASGAGWRGTVENRQEAGESVTYLVNLGFAVWKVRGAPADGWKTGQDVAVRVRPGRAKLYPAVDDPAPSA
jgi:iron(III) transport system ATP-binding protein